MRPKNIPYRQTWQEVEVNLIGAMLYHSDSLVDAKKLLGIEDKVCLNYAAQKKLGGDVDPNLNNEQSQLMEEFTLIGRQLNVVLLHMRNRLDGQGTFINQIKETIAIAQRLIDEAIVEKNEREEK